MHECTASVDLYWQGKKKITQIKTCPSATLSTTDSTQTDLGLNLDLCGVKTANKYSPSLSSP